MELRNIRLTNFRQFYGTQSLDLSTDPERNLTLIRDQNGGGRTTLLNSVLWCLYGSTMKPWSLSENILNVEAEREGQSRACAEATFTHQNDEYMARREIFVTDIGHKRQQFGVFHVFQDTHRPVPSAVDFIHSVIPKELAPCFFFDGEDAKIDDLRSILNDYSEVITGVSGYDEFKRAEEAIARSINNILDRFLHEDCVFKFRENFAPELLHRDGTRVFLSTGTKRLVCLAFMAALVQLSMTRFQSEDGHHLTPALIAPLILVSPWDVLDVRRRLGVARFVPTMASQVVLMLTRFDSTDEEVLAALEPRVGREYALVLDRPPHFGRTRIERIDRP